MSEPEIKPWIQADLALEVWKYYGGIGGADKDRMIQIVTWLLGISGGIAGFYATGSLRDRLSTFLLLSLGGLVSVLAAVISLMYGGYALWNWAIADRIATAYNWQAQKPDYDPIPKSAANTMARLSLWFAGAPASKSGPCQKKIAPIFWIFFFGSLVSLGVHVTLLFYHALCK